MCKNNWTHNAFVIIFITDSPESAEKEIKIFFKDFNIEQWLNNEEVLYNSDNLHFDPVLFVHTVDKSIINRNNLDKIVN